MKDIMMRIIKINIIFILFIIMFINNNYVYADSFQYSSDVVDNLAFTMASEGGCGKKEYFVYQLIWGAVFMNNYSRIVGLSTPITTASMCRVYSYGSLYAPGYCYYDSNKFASEAGGYCSKEQTEQLRLAARMVLSKSFNIPKNVYMAAEDSVINIYGITWVSYKPGSWTINFAYEKGKTLATTDIYGNSVSQDFSFYKTLAACLYNHPTLYGAYNKCSNTSTTSEYVVYLYPNGGTGIKDGQEFKYTETTPFSKFPTVTKTNCTLDGWNIDSPNGKEYNEDVEPIDNGKKLYARWNCRSTDTTKYTVTFKIDNDTSEIFHSEKVTSGSKVTKPSTNPSKYGYEFEGWKTSNGKDFDFNTKITSNITLYAKWGLEGDELVKPINPIKEETTYNDKANQDVETSAKTGTFEEIIVLVLIIPSLLAIYYYYNYYINSRKDSQS